MGDVVKEAELAHIVETDSKRASIIAILMALIAFLAPAAVAGYDFGYDSFLSITSILWVIYMDGYNVRFEFINPFYLMGMIPFLMFRVAFVYQITRYYRGKTTRGRTAAGAVISEAPFFAMYALWIITVGIYGAFGYNFPLPIMMIVGLLLLWRFPVSEVTVPWKGANDQRAWWEENTEDKTEPATDNQPL